MSWNVHANCPLQAANVFTSSSEEAANNGRTNWQNVSYRRHALLTSFISLRNEGVVTMTLMRRRGGDGHNHNEWAVVAWAYGSHAPQPLLNHDTCSLAPGRTAHMTGSRVASAYGSHAPETNSSQHRMTLYWIPLV